MCVTLSFLSRGECWLNQYLDVTLIFVSRGECWLDNFILGGGMKNGLNRAGEGKYVG